MALFVVLRLFGRFRGVSRRGLVLAAAAPVLTILAVVLVPWPGLSWSDANPYASTLRRVVAIDEGTGRTRAVQFPVALSVVASNPILGVGPGQWHDAADDHAHAARDHHVEGAFGAPAPFAILVRIAAETGLCGVLFFSLAAVALLWGGWRRVRQETSGSDAWWRRWPRSGCRRCSGSRSHCSTTPRR